VAEELLQVMVDRKKNEKVFRTQTQSSQAQLSDLFSLCRNHYLTFPEPPKIAPPAGNQIIIHMTLQDTFHIQTKARNYAHSHSRVHTRKFPFS
jgi:hypothetical protein